MPRFLKPTVLAIIWLLVFACIPAGLKAESLEVTNLSINVNGDDVIINWSTNQYATAWVDYGTTEDYGEQKSSGGNVQLAHSVELKNLEEETKYYFRITAKSAGATVSTLGLSFETKEADDGKYPVISNFRLAYVTGSTATIQWQTDEPTTTVIEYGKDQDDYDKKYSSSKRTINHDVTLKNLNLSTTYYYQISSADKQGNTVSLKYKSFRTSDLEPDIVLSLYNLSPLTANDKNIGTDRVIISWETNKLADGEIRYGTNPNKLKTVSVDGLRSLRHQKEILGLESDTVYYFEVKSKDVFGKTITSPKTSFRTKSSDLQIFDIEVSEEKIPVNALSEFEKSQLLRENLISLRDNTVKALKVSWRVTQDSFCKIIYKHKPIGSLEYNYSLSTNDHWQDGTLGDFIFRPTEGVYAFKVACYDPIADPTKLNISYSPVQHYAYTFSDRLVNGSVVKIKESNQIYHIYQGKKYLIADDYTLNVQGWNNKIEEIDSSILENYPTGGVLYGKYFNTNVVKYQNNPKVYMIEGQYKRPIASPEVFLGLGYDWGDIEQSKKEDLDYYALGDEVVNLSRRLKDNDIFKLDNSPNVYYLKNNRLRLIRSERAFNRSLVDWEGIKIISDQQFASLEPGEPVE